MMTNAALTDKTRTLLLAASVSTLTNLLLKRGIRNAYLHGVQPLCADTPRFVGPAYTLRFIPAREDLDTMANYSSDANMHRRAIEECPPGHVLVIDAGGSSRGASAGDMMVARLKVRGVAGLVTDGGYRDIEDIRALGFPAYQRQTAPPATPIALHAAGLNDAIGCAGVAVYPGDIVVGGPDGVIVIPRHLADDVAEEAAGVAAYEVFAAEKIAEGRSLFGVFPSTPESRAEYGAWLAQKSK